MGFTRDEAGVPLLRERAEKFVPGFLDPGRDIFGGTWIAGQDSQDATDW